MGAYETERKSAHDFTKYTDCHIVNLSHYRFGHGDEQGLDVKNRARNCYCAVCFKCPESLSGEEESNRFLCAAYLGGGGLFYTPVYINGKILTNVCGYATIHGDSKYNFERIKKEFK